jgi:creatinine amidohydrolase/Fe(II)-dependent formamide hydrolase-like protein
MDGTVSISANTLYSMINDIYSFIDGSGLTSLVILNGHGGNYVPGNVVQEGSAQGKRMALFPSSLWSRPSAPIPADLVRMRIIRWRRTRPLQITQFGALARGATTRRCA